MAIEWIDSPQWGNGCSHLYHATHASDCSLNKSFYCLGEDSLTLQFVHNKSVTFHVKNQAHAERIIEAIEGG